MRIGNPVHLTGGDLPGVLEELTAAGVTGHELDVASGRLLQLGLVPGTVAHAGNGDAIVRTWVVYLEVEVPHPLPPELAAAIADAE